MADAATAAGVGPEVEYKGRVYQFQPVRVQEIGRFEVWLERQAWESVYRAGEWMPPAMLRRLEEGTRQDVAAKAYSYGSAAFGKAMVSEPGLRQMALISLRAGEGNDPTCDGELVESLFKDKPAEMLDVMVRIGWLRRPDGETAKPDAPQ